MFKMNFPQGKQTLRKSFTLQNVRAARIVHGRIYKLLVGVEWLLTEDIILIAEYFL